MVHSNDMNFRSVPKFELNTKDKDGNLIASPNNKESDVAFLFDNRDLILEKASELVESSMLQEEQQVDFKEALRAFIKEIEQEASSLARRDDDVHTYRLRLFYRLEKACKKEITEADKKEWLEVIKACNGLLLEMTSRDKREQWFVSKIRGASE